MSDKSKPAFPCDTNYTYALEQNVPTGMTLREYYAGLAMQGLAVHAEFEFDTAETIATRSRLYADALIAELQREDTDE